MNLNKYHLNPLNLRKKNYSKILRIFEEIVKRMFVWIFFLSFFIFFFYNLKKKKRYLLVNFFNQNGSVFLISSILKIKNSVILFKLKDFPKIFSRFGAKYILCNFAYTPLDIDSIKIGFETKNNDINLNLDYFLFFDNKYQQDKSTLVMPFYLPKNDYLLNFEEKYKLYRNNKKKFKIVFSGSVHEEWYDQFPFFNDLKSRKNFLSRTFIINSIKKNFKDNLEVIYKEDEIEKIYNTKKEIIFLLTDPDKSYRRKNFSRNLHMKIISESKFFICMPGTSMPLSYHLIESALVGTVPILSCNKFLEPKLSLDNSILFFDENELIDSINNSLNMNEKKYLELKKNIEIFYNENWSSESFSKKIINKNLPLEIYANFDHYSYNLRRIRMGLSDLFK